MSDDSSDRSNIFTRMAGFSNHPNIQIIKVKYQHSLIFKFEPVITDQAIKFIDEIDCNKNSSVDIPANVFNITKDPACMKRL